MQRDERAVVEPELASITETVSVRIPVMSEALRFKRGNLSLSGWFTVHSVHQTLHVCVGL